MTAPEINATLIGLIGLLLMVAIYVVKRELAKLSALPDPKWFDGTGKSIQQIIEALRELRELASEQKEQLALLKQRVEWLEARQTKDHERLGKVEAQVSFLAQRMDQIDRREAKG